MPNSLAQIYGTAKDKKSGTLMTSPGMLRTLMLSQAFGKGPSGPYDISHPLMGFALGRGISQYEADQRAQLALEEAKKTELPLKWQQAVAADPTLASDPVKMTNWFMTNAPDMLKNLQAIFQAQKAGAEAGETTALTGPRVEKTKAEAFRTGVTLPTLDIARAGEAGARTGLLGAQTTTEAYRPSLLEAQTGAQRSLAELYGERGITEREKRPYSLEETQAATERWKALAGKLRKETELMPTEKKYTEGFKEAKLKEMWDRLSEEAKLKVIGALPADKALTEGNILSAYANLMTDPAVREELKPIVDEILRRTMQKRGPELPESGRPPVVFK